MFLITIVYVSWPPEATELTLADLTTLSGLAGAANAPGPVVASDEPAPIIPRVAMAAAESNAVPKSGKSLYDSLEKEMANLLGRPSGKP